MTNLQAHIIEWLDEIGADGLMSPKWGEALIWGKEYIELSNELSFPPYVVPAFRHADGTYHVEPECCVQCRKDHEGFCAVKWECCSLRKSWLAHKEATK